MPVPPVSFIEYIEDEVRLESRFTGFNSILDPFSLQDKSQKFCMSTPACITSTTSEFSLSSPPILISLLLVCLSTV